MFYVVCPHVGWEINLDWFTCIILSYDTFHNFVDMIKAIFYLVRLASSNI